MFTLIADIRANMLDIEKIFADRFEKLTYSTHLDIKNSARLKKSSTEKQSNRPNFAFVQILTSPLFDIDTNFKISYKIQLYIMENEIKIYDYILLLVTRETPLGDPWSVTIQSSSFAGTSIEEIEPKITELLHQQFEHAKTFRSENPLEKTPYETVYPRIREMFIQSKWNEALESSSHYELFSSGFYKGFGSELDALRHEVYALGKTQHPKESLK